MVMHDEWRRYAADGDIEEAIWLYVRDFDWTIFPDLQTDLGPYLETRGKVEFRLAPNLVLWGGLSVRLTNAIVKMIQAERISIEGINKTVYTLSGATLPDYKTIEYSKQLASPRVKSWVPVCFRLPQKRERKNDRG